LRSSELAKKSQRIGRAVRVYGRTVAVLDRLSLWVVVLVVSASACHSGASNGGAGPPGASVVGGAGSVGDMHGTSGASASRADAMSGATHATQDAGVAGSSGSGTSSAGAPTTSGSAGADPRGTPGTAGTNSGAAGAAGTVEPPTATIPMPVTTPYVWGVGIGITDVAAAVKFYTEVMKMTVEQKDIRREDRTETVLVSSEAKRGSRVVLMNFDDKRSTRNITAKLVWNAPDPSAVSTAAATYPDYVSRLAGLIVQFDGPETYIQEVTNGLDSGGAGITVPYLIALGMSVSDQQASINFYTTAFGMTQAPTGTFPLTDATGAATVTEYTVQYSTEGGSSIVLQSWAPARNSKDNPVKIVLFVPDAQAAADKVVAAGGTVSRPAVRTPVYENRKLVVAKDLDGYELELVE
jgi:predicted enzyme related to lactoylglutathione lyase